MKVSTRATQPNTPQADCLRKTEFKTKKEAKGAAKRRRGPTSVYECPWPNRDGSSGTHWHYSHRHPRKPSASV